MILAIFIALLSVANLLLLSSIKQYRRETFLVALLQCAFVIQAVHLIFDGMAGPVDNYPLLVKAAFGVVHLALTGLLILNLTIAYVPRRTLVAFLLVVSPLFYFLYNSFLMQPRIEVMAYSHLIWYLEVILLVLISRKFWFDARLRNPTSLDRSHYRLGKLWCLVLLTPYLVELTVYAVPSDNFILSYQPVLSTQETVDVITGVLLMFFFFQLVHHKKVLESENALAGHQRSIKDLAF